MAVQIETQSQVAEFLGILKRRFWQIILPAIIVTSIGVFLAVIIPKKFVAETQIELRQVDLPSMQKDGGYISNIVQDADMAPYQLKSRARVQDVIRSLGWPEYLALERNPERGPDMQEFVKQVQSDISVSVPALKKVDTTRFVTIKYQNTRGDRAQQFLIALRDNWIDDVILRDENRLRTERDTLKDDRNKLEKLLETERENLAALRKSYGLSPTRTGGKDRGPDQDPDYLRIVEMADSLQEVRENLVEIEGQIEERIAQRDQMEPEIINVYEDGGVNLTEGIALIELQILSEKEKQARYLPQHSRWTIAQRKIEALEKEILELAKLETEGEEKEIRKPNLEYSAVQSEIDRLESQRAGLRRKEEVLAEAVAGRGEKLEELTDVYKQVAAYEDSIDRLEESLSQTDQKYWDMVQQFDMVEAGAVNPFRITADAQRPSAPTEPNPLLVVALAAVLGLGLGLAWAVLAEFSKNCFRNIQDISRVMTVPVLGCVNKITTRAEVRRRFLTRFLLGFSSLAVAGTILFVTSAWYYRRDLLHQSVQQAIEQVRALLV